MQLHAVTEVSKFQQLLHYINGGHGNQLSTNYDTRTMAKYYQDLRVVMKKAKQFLKQDAEYVHHCINTTPEDSDGICSKASSLDPESQLHGVKVSKATELSSEVVKEFKEETTEESVEESVEESYSSADETDDEILDAKMVARFIYFNGYLYQPCICSYDSYLKLNILSVTITTYTHTHTHTYTYNFVIIHT